MPISVKKELSPGVLLRHFGNRISKISPKIAKTGSIKMFYLEEYHPSSELVPRDLEKSLLETC